MAESVSREREDRVVTACLLIIGDEILSGRTQDKNLAFLGRGLNELGVRLLEARVLPDDEAVIVAQLNEVRARHDYVFTTGGIGPTHDDITADCVAKAFGLPLIENPEARAIMEAHYGRAHLTPARLRMARTPEGASLVENPVNKVPGFRIGNVFVFAGIPAIMQAMFESIAHSLVGGKPMLSATIVAELREGELAEPLGAVQARYKDVAMGSYPFVREGVFGANLVLRSTDPERLEDARRAVCQMLRDLGVEPKGEGADETSQPG